MLLKEFIEEFIEHNTLIRLWNIPSNGKGYEETIKGDKPMMEWEILKSDWKDKRVICITDILYEGSNYIESVNIVIEK